MLHLFAGPGAVPSKPGKQEIELVSAVLERDQHVLAKFRFVGVLLGVPEKQRHLARQVLYVVHHKGHATIEFIEATGFGQRCLTALLGEIAGQLAANDAQKVEIFPVQFALDRRTGKNDYAY